MTQSTGYLEICIGPMYSGKTSQLIKHYNKYMFIEKKICVINYHLDKRYHETMLSTHDKHMIPCIPCDSISSVMEQCIESDVILINEAQFFTDLYNSVLTLLELHKKTIFIYALDGDFERKKFGSVLDLIPHCDEIYKLQSLCHACRDGTKAIFSHRLTNESSQVIIGNYNYIPLCRKCYMTSFGTVKPDLP